MSTNIATDLLSSFRQVQGYGIALPKPLEISSLLSEKFSTSRGDLQSITIAKLAMTEQ